MYSTPESPQVSDVGPALVPVLIIGLSGREEQLVDIGEGTKRPIGANIFHKTSYEIEWKYTYTKLHIFVASNLTELMLCSSEMWNFRRLGSDCLPRDNRSQADGGQLKRVNGPPERKSKADKLWYTLPYCQDNPDLLRYLLMREG